MNEKHWIFKRPSLIIACAIYLAAAVLILLGGVYYRCADEALQAQRMDVVDKTLQSAVQTVNEEMQAMQTAALNIRSRLRYIAMPSPSVMTAEDRLALHDASALMKALLSSTRIVQSAYLYAADVGYAVTPSAVLAADDLPQLYTGGGFSPAEADGLHAIFSLGGLVSSENGGQMAYLLSSGKDAQTGAPHRQLVLLLKRSLLQTLLSDLALPEAQYTLLNPQGAQLEQFCIGDASPASHTFVYPLNNGCTLQVALAAGSIHDTARSTRNVYIATVAISLVLITGIAAVTCRFSRVPIAQMIDYIRRHYAIRADVQDNSLAGLRDAVEDILESQSSAQYQLQERDESQRWERIIHSLAAGQRRQWQGKNYVMLVFSPQPADQAALFAALESLGAQADAHALLSLRDGMALLLGSKSRMLTAEETVPLAEALLSALDEEGVMLRAAVSACHCQLDELRIAHREARMALDCLLMGSDAPVVSYRDCDFHPNAFHLDMEYLSRQQHFNRLVSQGRYDEAAGLLPALTAKEEDASRSEAGRMYLEMLKYQMISCLSLLYPDTGEANELRRNAIREVLLCQSPRQVTALMEGLLRELALPDAAEEPGSGDDTLLAIKQYVRAHFADPQLSVTALAEQFGMSPNSVSKLFSRKAGMGVLQYIHKIRIENACNLILSTELTLSEVAQRVGYTSSLTFTRAFKARYHMSPSEWRKLNEAINS